MVSPLSTSQSNEELGKEIHFLHISLWWPLKPWLLQFNRQNSKINGITIDKKETKLLQQYADDTTAVLSDINLAQTLFKLLDDFKKLTISLSNWKKFSSKNQKKYWKLTLFNCMYIVCVLWPSPSLNLCVVKTTNQITLHTQESITYWGKYFNANLQDIFVWCACNFYLQ